MCCGYGLGVYYVVTPRGSAPPARTETMTQAAADIRITVQVARLIVSGMTPQDALRSVCGDDKFDAMVSELYAGLRAKGAA